MPYCALADVQGLITGFTITTTSTVTVDTVDNDIIPMVDRYIDDRLGQYYVTPITGPNALLTINRIARLLCAAEVAERVYIGQAPADSAQSTVWRQQAEDTLARLTTGDPTAKAAKGATPTAGMIILTDAVPTGDTPEPMSQKISDVLSTATYTGSALFSTQKQF